jgi:hypothetical protein
MGSGLFRLSITGRAARTSEQKHDLAIKVEHIHADMLKSELEN